MRAREPKRRRGRYLWALLAVFVLLLAACGGGTNGDGEGDATAPDGQETQTGMETEDDGQAGGGETIEVSVSPSGLPVFVAAEEGLFEDVNIEVSQVGYDQSAALFLAGDTPIGWVAPLEVAEFVSEGEEFRYFSTAGATNMINGLVVRTEDAEQYQSVEDLVGETVGNPGFGTGTWATFDVILQSQFDINPREEFNNVTADSGALLGLLEAGEIEAALLFSGQSAAAIASDEFTTIFSFTEAWQEATGHPMVINGPVARASWLDEHQAEAAAIVDGIDAAVQWMKDNPDEFREDGKYEDWVESEGWLSSPETTEGIMQLLEDGELILTSEVYTQDWVDSIYELIQAGEGTLVETVPSKDEIFYPPANLEGGS